MMNQKLEEIEMNAKPFTIQIQMNPAMAKKFKKLPRRETPTKAFNMRLKPKVEEKLNQLATDLGMSKAGVIESLLMDADKNGCVASLERDEAIRKNKNAIYLEMNKATAKVEDLYQTIEATYKQTQAILRDKNVPESINAYMANVIQMAEVANRSYKETMDKVKGMLL